MGSKKDIFLWTVLFAVFVASILVIYHFSRVKKEALGIKDELEIKASETTVVKRLSDNEIRKLQNKGEVVLCSAEGLIPDYTRGEFVIVNKDTNEVKAATHCIECAATISTVMPVNNAYSWNPLR